MANKYIDAEKLKELIDEKWKELAVKNVKVGGGKWDAEISTYLSVLGLIDTLEQEQREVDLEEEIEEHAIYMPHGEFASDNEREEDMEWAREEFHHFYNLGLKARK